MCVLTETSDCWALCLIWHVCCGLKSAPSARTHAGFRRRQWFPRGMTVWMRKWTDTVCFKLSHRREVGRPSWTFGWASVNAAVLFSSGVHPAARVTPAWTHPHPSLLCLCESRRLRCCSAALQVSPWPQRLLWKMSHHRQPEAVLLQRQPKHVWGPKAGCESETEPDHSVHAELRLLQRSRQANSQPPLLQPAGQQTDPPLRLPGASVHTLLGTEQSHCTACLYGGGVGTPQSGGAGPAARAPVWRLVHWWRERPTETEAVHTGKQSRPPPQQRRV